MKTIQLFVPDYFTDEQIEIVKEPAQKEIEIIIRNSIAIPQEEVERVQTEIEQVKQAVELDKAEQLAKVQPVVEVKEVV